MLIRVLFLSLIFSMVAEAQAPLCTSVLLKDHSKISQADIDQTIASIARMKMELDLAKAEGLGGNSVNSMLHQEYSVKILELKQHLRDRMSGPELHRKITEQINLLQGAKKINEAEAKQRAEVTKLTKPYVLVSETEIKDLDGYIIGNLPSQNLIITRDSSVGNLPLYLMDLSTQNRTPLVDSNSSVSVSNDNKMLITIKLGEVKVWELNPLKEVSRFEIQDFVRPNNVVLSPSGKTVLIYTAGKAYLLDTKTGNAKYIFSGESFTKSGDPMKFLNENEIAFVDGTPKISVFDIGSGKTTSFPSQFALKSIWVSPDGKKILWESTNVNNDRTIGLIDKGDLANIGTASRILPSPVYLARFHPTKDLLYVYSPGERGLYQQSTFEQVESFPIDPADNRKAIHYHTEPLYDSNTDRIYLPKTGGKVGIRSITLEVWERN